MIASFSGIGGSGKTTQINDLARDFHERRVRVAVLATRDYLRWPRVVAALKRGTGAPPGKEGPAHAARRASFGKHAVRALFYLADFWRFHLLEVLPRARRELVILDRAYADFVVELALDRGRFDALLRLVLSLTPRARVAFWFDPPAEVALKRKFEVPMEELLRHQAMYRNVMPRVSHVRVDSSRDRAATQQLLRGLARMALASAGPFDAQGALLLADAPLAGLAPDAWTPYLRAAAHNRMLLAALRALEGAPGAREAFAGAYAAARARASAADVADAVLARFSAETGTPAVAIKRGHGVELGSDLDAVFKHRADLARFAAWTEEGGKGEVARVDADKLDAFFPDALPVDGHVGFTVAGFAYLSSDDIFDHPRESEALAIIAHAATELTMITAGDLRKVAALGDLDAGLMDRIAASHGWRGIVRHWLRFDAARHGYALPYRFPAPLLLWWRLRRYAHRLDGSPFRDLWMMARGIRARMLGKLPYHDPWFRI